MAWLVDDFFVRWNELFLPKLKKMALTHDSRYLLRGLNFPQVEEEVNPEMANRGLSELKVSEKAETELAQRSASIRIIACQVAFFSCALVKNIDLSSLSDRNHALGTGGPLVSVIGCGMLGNQILKTLLAMGWPPSCLGACSRNEEHFSQFASLGVQCTTDISTFERDMSIDSKITDKFGKMIIIAVPYAQLRALASTLSNPNTPNKTIIMSAVAGTSHSKLCQLLPSFPHIIRATPQLSKLVYRSFEPISVNEEFPLISSDILEEAALHLICSDLKHVVVTFQEFYTELGDDKDDVSTYIYFLISFSFVYALICIVLKIGI